MACAHPHGPALIQDIIAEDPDVARFVDMHVAWRLDHTVEDEGSFYPINMLRNMALQNVMTGMGHQHERLAGRLSVMHREVFFACA
jgi:hypothetical protein